MPPEFAFWIMQTEQTPTHGIPHLQMYIETRKRTSFADVLLLLPHDKRPHIELARGSKQDSIDYCTKDATRIVDGYWTRREGAGKCCFFTDLPSSLIRNTEGGPGRRTDLLDFCKAVKRGATDRELCEDEHISTFAKYFKAGDRIRAAVAMPRTEMPTVHIYWGPTGTGKSHAARGRADGICGPDKQCWKMPGCKWFEGLTSNHKVFVWDEFVDGDAGISLGYLLRILDKYPLSVEYKGGSTPFNCSAIIFTSNFNPWDWFPNVSHESKAAWHRRLGMCNVLHMNAPYTRDDDAETLVDVTYGSQENPIEL